MVRGRFSFLLFLADIDYLYTKPSNSLRKLLERPKNIKNYVTISFTAKVKIRLTNVRIGIYIFGLGKLFWEECDLRP